MRIPFHRWTDLRHCAGWRLQRRVDDRYRIQDGHDRTHWQGGPHNAFQRFAELVSQHHLHWSGDRFIVTLHGLLHSRDAMARLSRTLQETLRADPINFEYATSWAVIEQHAQALDQVLCHLPPDRPVDFVSHSMGGIVMRRWFGMLGAGEAQATQLRLGRLVMLGPPNQGSVLAARLGRFSLSRYLLGVAAEQLGDRWAELQESLPLPPIPFGIITARVPRWLPNPLMLQRTDRPHDWIVRESETFLDGATDHVILPGVHAWMMLKRSTIEAATYFLQHGHFPDACRRPVRTSRDRYDSAANRVSSCP